MSVRRVGGLTVVVCLALIVAPEARADDWTHWDRAVEQQQPSLGSAVPSVEYARSPVGKYPDTDVTGVWQVYAAPRGVIPGPADYCGTTVSQALIPVGCLVPGSEVWFR